MSVRLHPHTIVYSSNLIVANPRDLATLCLFYDEVALPALGTNEYIELRRPKGSRQDWAVSGLAVYLRYEGLDGDSHVGNEEFDRWDRDHRELFVAGAIRRLPGADGPLLSDLIIGSSITSLGPKVLATQHILRSKSPRGDEFLFIHEAQVEHLLRRDVAAPSVFVAATRAAVREIMKVAQAQAVFSILLPAASAKLSCEQILALRDSVSDTREGFAMHLQTLSSQVEKGLQAGASLEEIATVAASIVDATLVPDYAEFRRQLSAKRAGIFGKILDPLGKILQIDAAPWTPKFWGGILSALGSAFGVGIEADTAELTNRTQAFQFMRAIEAADK